MGPPPQTDDDGREVATSWLRHAGKPANWRAVSSTDIVDNFVDNSARRAASARNFRAGDRLLKV